jgi:DNA-binding NtrC family response regulator
VGLPAEVSTLLGGSMEANKIPLKILICDQDKTTAKSLQSFVSQDDLVSVAQIAHNIDDAQTLLRSEDYNTIFIDVINLGIVPASEFVFSIRKALPEIVFVLYIDKKSAESMRREFYGDERRRYCKPLAPRREGSSVGVQ